MAIEFYDLDCKGDDAPLFQLEEGDFIAMWKVFDKFEELTGMALDPYGTSRIHLDHQKLLCKLLVEYDGQRTGKGHDVGVTPALRLRRFIELSMSKKVNLLMEGE